MSLPSRTEYDSFGPIEVHDEHLWGAQTQRSLEHFAISTEKMPAELIAALLHIKRAAAIVNHELGLISRVFEAAAKDWGIALPRGNPVKLTRRPKVANERDRRLVGPEEDLLLAALGSRRSPWPRPAAILAIETAGRMSELLALKWSEVDLKTRVAKLRGKNGGVTKNGDEFREVPLSTRAVQLLGAQPRSTTGLVLPISQNALQIAWGRAVAAARKEWVIKKLSEELAARGFDEETQAREHRAWVYKKRKPLPITLEILARLDRDDATFVDLHFHDLRHEGTSRLAERLQMHELMKVTGHKSSRMLDRYYHPRIADLAKKLA